ncbi:MAG: hypothetical protein AB7I04_23595 [Pseudomonadales bacterium]
MTQLVAGRSVSRTANDRLLLSVLLLSLSTLLAGCDEPFIVMAGGALVGEPEDPPVDWTPLNDVEVVQLETRPEDPYSVNVWMIASGRNLYVATGKGDTRWTRHIAVNPDVRVRIDGRIYELEAYLVADQTEKIAIGNEYVEKYGVDEDDNWVDEGQLYRLDRR